MDDEMNEEVASAIGFYVWSGWYDQDEVFDIITDEVENENEDYLRKAVDREFHRKREAERDWPTVTDCDRLDLVFESLTTRGILTRHRCGLTIQDGLEVIEQLYDEAGEQKPRLTGYCFYHLQDMEAAMWGKIGLWLAFGGFPSTYEQAAQVGLVVREEFERVGFTVVWDGTPGSRILLKEFRWRKR